MKTVHMAQSVRGPLINWTWKDWKSATHWITKPDGSRYTVIELKNAFLDLLVAGNEVIPLGKQCDNWDPKKGCLGHDDGVEAPPSSACLRGEPAGNRP